MDIRWIGNQLQSSLNDEFCEVLVSRTSKASMHAGNNRIMAHASGG